MNDHRIGDLMRTLPRTNASPAFTREVMRKAQDHGTARKPLVWRMAAAFAMAACLLAVVQLGVLQQRQQKRTLALQAEQQQLAADLQKIVEESEPVVVLENEDGTRVIMDLDSAIQPASLRNYD